MTKLRYLQLLVLSVLLASCSSPPALPPTEVDSSQTIKVDTPTLPASPTATPQIWEVFLDGSLHGSGIEIMQGGDVDYQMVTAGDDQVKSWQTGNGAILPGWEGNQVEDWYLAFNIDDDILQAAKPTSRVRIEVEYLDQGLDQFNLHYDAGDLFSPSESWFTPTKLITKQDSNTFQIAVFTLDNAYFGNRTNGGDFRLADNADGPEIIRSVRVVLLPPPEQTLSTPSPGVPVAEDEANIVFLNGTVITMDHGLLASAIAIKNETILAVGEDQEILAYAGPGTTTIDLAGKTILPGFIDSHSHILNNPYRDDLLGGQAVLLANGITTSAELFVEEDLILDLQHLNESDQLLVRLSLYPVHVDNCGNTRGDWYSQKYPVTKQPGAMLHIPGIKIFTDGGSCNGPAVSYEYLNDAGSGDLYFQADQLSTLISDAQDKGYQVAIHALGDRAIDVNLKAIELALAGGPNQYRHRIEHNTVLRDDLLPRYSEVDPVATIFGFFPTCVYEKDPSAFRFFPPAEFLELEWRWRDLRDTNPDLRIAWHSDTPYSVGPKPLVHLHSMVTRIQHLEDGTICYPAPWAADDLLTVEESLEMMTINAAYALFRDHEIGSLAAGKLADLVILSANPLEVDPPDLLETSILMTMVGGETKYCASGQDPLCP